MARLFFSYSHDDETYRDQLEKHLAMLKNQRLIESWHDRRIEAGSSVDDVIQTELDKADIILLLISASFLASAYCYSKEMTRALERHRLGEAVVIPVIVRPCDWHPAPFGSLLAAPRDGKAIYTWPNFDEAYADVARQLRTVVERLAKGKPVPSTGGSAEIAGRTAAASSQAAPTMNLTEPRSSNLGLRKEFSDLDKDAFLKDSFRRSFKASMEELEKAQQGNQSCLRRDRCQHLQRHALQAGQEGGRVLCAQRRERLLARKHCLFIRCFSTRQQHERITFGGCRHPDHVSALHGYVLRRRPRREVVARGWCRLLWGMFIERLQ